MRASALDETHDGAARSWVESACRAETDFPIQNLPIGVFRVGNQIARGGLAIGDEILDLNAAAPLMEGPARRAALAAGGPSIAPLMGLEPEDWSALRLAAFRLLRSGAPGQAATQAALLRAAQVEMVMPVRPGAFVDFFASIDHATNAGRMFRPESPLLPNYKHVPIGYHGRASTIRVSGHPIRRPAGQTKLLDQAGPAFQPCRNLDYELELGIFLGGTTAVGAPVAVEAAHRHIFGVCLLNDWSARDIQAWEYQPLGPFLAKSFGTTISPWIITADALLPFRVPAAPRAPGDPRPLPYLFDEDDQAGGAIAVTVEAALRTQGMRAVHTPAHRLSRSSAGALYWTPAQMVAHQTSNGCNLEPGDLYGTGTISGPSLDSLGSLMELTQRGTQPITLPNGETRGYLEDGDEVVFRGRCERTGFASIGFGACSGQVVPSLAP